MNYKLKRHWLLVLRESKGFTRHDVATSMGISGSHYSNIENGRKGIRGQLIADHYLTLSVVFNVPLTDIHRMEQDYLKASKLSSNI